MRLYTVKENHIGSAISKMLWYEKTQTQTQLDILLLSLGYDLYESLKKFQNNYSFPWEKSSLMLQLVHPFVHPLRIKIAFLV